MVDKREVDIGKLVNEWEERKEELKEDPVSVVCILFPYLDELTDQKVGEFYKRIEEHGYVGPQFETVWAVRALNKTYQTFTPIEEFGWV